MYNNLPIQMKIFIPITLLFILNLVLLRYVLDSNSIIWMSLFELLTLLVLFFLINQFIIKKLQLLSNGLEKGELTSIDGSDEIAQITQVLNKKFSTLEKHSNSDEELFKSISSIADSIAKGDISRRVETPTKNPMLMQLKKDFNGMADKLEASVGKDMNSIEKSQTLSMNLLKSLSKSLTLSQRTHKQHQMLHKR